MDAGSRLRQAREARGLSRSDLSARTKISPAILAAIEEGAFDQLPADIYLRGFVRAYAAEVGLPPGEAVQQYLAERERTSHALSAFESEATIVDSGADLALPASSPFDAFASEADPSAAQPSSAVPATAPAGRAPQATMRAPLPASLVAALAAGVVAAIGTVAAVRWTGSADSVTLAAMPSETAATGSAAPAAVSSAIPAVPVAPASSSASNGTKAAAAVQSIAGEWMLTNHVQATNYKPFEGLQLGYRLRLEQDGDTVTGRGEKWSENGRAIPEARRTPIEISGTFRAGHLDLAFTERGTRRTSAGRFAWVLSDAGAMSGTFASDAAHSQGSSLVRRAE